MQAAAIQNACSFAGLKRQSMLLLRRRQSWCAVVDALPNHGAKFRRILMSMDGNGVLDGGVEQLAFAVRRNSDSAISFAWEFTAIDELATHDVLLTEARR